MTDLPYIERARQREAARRLQAGEITVPLACQFCQGGVELTAADTLQCLQCGRSTDLQTAHRIRRQKMAAIIREGVDIDLSRGRQGG